MGSRDLALPSELKLIHALYRHLARCPQCSACLVGRTLLEAMLTGMVLDEEKPIEHLKEAQC